MYFKIISSLYKRFKIRKKKKKKTEFEITYKNINPN